MFTQMCASVAMGTIRKPGTGVKSKITSAVKTIVEHQMQLDDETLYVHVKSFIRYSNRLNRIRNRSPGCFYLVYTSFVLSSNGAFFLHFVGMKRNLFRVLYCRFHNYCGEEG